MDTDDLSNETYEAVIIEAERFHHNLTLHFGLLAGQCDTEEECLNFDLYDLYDRHDFNTKFLKISRRSRRKDPQI
jgi:hypothetical protein